MCATWQTCTCEMCGTLQHCVVHCNTVWYTATLSCCYCTNTNKPISYTYASYKYTKKQEHTCGPQLSTHCNTLQHTATPCNTLQQPATTHLRPANDGNITVTNCLDFPHVADALGREVDARKQPVEHVYKFCHLFFLCVMYTRIYKYIYSIHI